MKRMIAVSIALMLSGCGEQPAGKPEAAAAPEPWPMEWTYQEGSCQHTETRVLIANAANLITWADPEACEIAAGSWQSWGRDVQLPLHLIWVVPLVTPPHAEMHGAADWSREQKLAFINDKDNLIVVDRVSASERGDLNPEAWTPLPRYWCEYAQRWQRVKQRYQLDSGEEEQKALARMLESCPAAE